MSEPVPVEPFEMPIRVDPADIDALNHVNNTVYLRWVQDVAKAHWFSALAFPRCVLVSPLRGGRRVARSLTQTVMDRIKQWSRSPTPARYRS